MNLTEEYSIDLQAVLARDFEDGKCRRFEQTDIMFSCFTWQYFLVIGK